MDIPMATSREYQFMKRTVTGTFFALALLFTGHADAADSVQTCRIAKGKSAVKYSACLLKVDAKFQLTADLDDYGPGVADCNEKFDEAWSKAETKGAGTCADDNPTPELAAAVITDCMECLERQITGGGGDCFCSLGECPGDGKSIGGRCWYSTVFNESCDMACTYHGLSYDPDTAAYAGSGGSFANCDAVLTAFGAPLASAGDVAGCSSGYGCAFDSNVPGRVRCTSPATTSSAFAPTVLRVCACE